MTDLSIGPAKHFAKGLVEFGEYLNGEIAITIYNIEGERIAVASVNMEGKGAKTPGPKHVWLKGWSENEGIPEALEKAGILKRTGETHPTGYCQAEFAEMLVDVK